MLPFRVNRSGRFPPVIAALLFVLFFLALGIGVVVIALSGGPSGARRAHAAVPRPARSAGA